MKFDLTYIKLQNNFKIERKNVRYTMMLTPYKINNMSMKNIISRNKNGKIKYATFI